jgi:hypothetical protein
VLVLRCLLLLTGTCFYAAESTVGLGSKALDEAVAAAMGAQEAAGGGGDRRQAAELKRRREAAQAVFAALFKAQEAAAAAAQASGRPKVFQGRAGHVRQREECDPA